MKILVLNGSPKCEQSDTIHITKSFLKGMNEVCNNDVKIINVIEKNIGYCKGCLACKKNGGVCVQKDDMQEILEEILASDILLLSFPLYCFSMPACLKVLIDRTMPLSTMAMRKVNDRYEHVEQRDFSHIRYLMISGCGFPSRKNNFEGLEIQFKMMFGDESIMITVPESPMFNVPEANSVTIPFLEVVKQAGKEYATSGSISKETFDKLKIPMIPEETYAKICNGE